MDNLKYKRNWAYEQIADVFFVNGVDVRCPCLTNNKGKIVHITYNDKQYTPDQFGELGVMSVHFMTPVSLDVKSPIDVLAKAYLWLGRHINEGDVHEVNRKIARRQSIEKEIRRRGVNIHDAMTQVSE